MTQKNCCARDQEWPEFSSMGKETGKQEEIQNFESHQQHAVVRKRKVKPAHGIGPAEKNLKTSKADIWQPISLIS